MPTVDIPKATSTVKPFYEQDRTEMPEKLSGVVAANVVRVGGGSDIFAVRGGGLIQRSSLSSSTVSSFSNGLQVINQVTITNTEGRRLVAVVERAVYVGSKVNANLLPGGSSIDESQFQVIGNNFAVIDSDGTTTEDYELNNQLYIRNISAGTITLLIDVRVKYIVNIAATESLSQ